MFSDNLKNIMRERNMSQARLASLLGVSKQTVSSWTNGRKIPRMKMLMSICDVLQCPIKALADPEQPSVREELDKVLYRLTEAQLIQLLDYARYLESR